MHPFELVELSYQRYEYQISKKYLNYFIKFKQLKGYKKTSSKMLHPNNIFLYSEKIIKIKIKNPVLIIDTKVQLAIFFLKKRL